MAEKFTNGSLVTYRVRDSFRPRTPAEIDAIAARHGMPSTMVPQYAGDRAMVGRAITSYIGKAKSAGWLLSSLTTGKTKVVYTIAAVEKDEARERTDFTHDATLKWDAEWDTGRITGEHEVARTINTAYQELRGMVLQGDWTAHIIDYIKGPCRGLPFLESGGMYWIPPQGTAQLESLRAYLDEVGIGLVIGEIEPESRGDVREVAQAGIADQIAALKAEVAGFDGSQSATVYRDRLGQLRELRAKAMAYDAAIGITLDDVRGALRSIDAQVRDLLTVRVDTVIHADGTRERGQAPPVDAQVQQLLALAAQGEYALASALADGSLSVDGDLDDVALLVEAGDEALDPDLAALLAAPGPASDLPTTW